MASDELNYDVQGHVGVITINRPEARNALNWSTYAALESSVRESTARCLVITGTDPAFCSGDDVKQIMGGGEKPPDLGSREPRLTPAADALLHTDIPVIAAVNGAAVGWGMELAMYADIRVASERAKFGELFVLRGLVTDVGGIGRLTSLVGRERAAELIFTGDVIDATEAERIGLVSRVVPHEELMTTAMALAGRIAANPPLAVQAIKRGLRKAVDPDWNDLGRWVSTNLGELFQTNDHREGVKSFLEKRAPEFTGT
jgi:enoyl-CoA hydratase/carnithine racemase